ncbi:MAG: MarR family transcriptional regulator [Sciscionella sp.]
MHYSRRTANLLGAAALGVTDLALARVTSAAAVSASGAAALVVLASATTLGVTELGCRVGLSQSAAARMAGSLERDGLVQRTAGAGRLVHVSLTEQGIRAAHELLAAREAPLADVLTALDEHEQRTLAELLEKLLPKLYGKIGNADLVCRLCDRPACTERAVCPVGQAERDRAG